MGSGIWFKNIISKKKAKGDGSQKLKRYSLPTNMNCSENTCTLVAKRASMDNHGRLGISVEDAAAKKIQTAYRAYSARKTLRRMRGMVRLQNLVKRDSVKKQASATVSHLHSWSRTQAQVRDRRVHMVAQDRLRQKKLGNQLKLEAKLHDLEVEWTGGSETIDKTLAKIHKREEAAVKRERAMAYAFSHQWRANSNLDFGSGNLELSKENWGWSWMDRWVAARPWESRIAVKESVKIAQVRQPNKTSKNKVSPAFIGSDNNKAKQFSPNGKAVKNVQKLSYEAPEKIAAQKANSKAVERKIKNEKMDLN